MPFLLATSVVAFRSASRGGSIQRRTWFPISHRSFSAVDASSQSPEQSMMDCPLEMPILSDSFCTSRATPPIWNCTFRMSLLPRPGRPGNRLRQTLQWQEISPMK
jgi:hypothetical protein